MEPPVRFDGEGGKALAFIFTERSQNIRIISARLVTRRERIEYEEGHE